MALLHRNYNSIKSNQLVTGVFITCISNLSFCLVACRHYIIHIIGISGWCGVRWGKTPCMFGLGCLFRALHCFVTCSYIAVPSPHSCSLCFNAFSILDVMIVFWVRCSVILVLPFINHAFESIKPLYVTVIYFLFNY